MSDPYGLIADLHLHGWSAFSETLPDGQNSRLVGLLDEIECCAAAVSRNGGNRVVLAGDVFHVRGSVAPSVFNAVRDRLKVCKQKYDTHFRILPGNHDLEGKESTRLGSAVTGLDSDWTEVYDEPVWSSRDNTLLVPWVEGIETLKVKLKELAETRLHDDHISQYDLILHAPIDGVIKGIPDHGLTPGWLAGLGFKRVFAGHYHNHKAFPGGVYSIGALAHHTWSDVGSSAGYLIVHPGRVEHFSSNLPRFVDLEQLVDVIEDEQDLIDAVSGNYVRVKVTADKAKEVEGARKELLDKGARAVIVQAEPVAPTRAGAVSATVAAGASLEVSVQEFIKGMTGVDVAEVTKAAMDVLGSVEAV